MLYLFKPHRWPTSTAWRRGCRCPKRRLPRCPRKRCGEILAACCGSVRWATRCCRGQQAHFTAEPRNAVRPNVPACPRAAPLRAGGGGGARPGTAACGAEEQQIGGWRHLFFPALSLALLVTFSPLPALNSCTPPPRLPCPLYPFGSTAVSMTSWSAADIPHNSHVTLTPMEEVQQAQRRPAGNGSSACTAAGGSARLAGCPSCGLGEAITATHS